MLRIMIVEKDRAAALKIRSQIPDFFGLKQDIMTPLEVDRDLSHISNPNINNQVSVVGIADTLSQAMQLYDKFHPHLAICAAQFVQGNVLEFIRQIHIKEKNMHFIVYDHQLDAYILRELISLGIDAFVLWEELLDGRLNVLLEDIHERTKVEATRRQFFFEKAIMDLFNDNAQDYLKQRDGLFLEKLKRPYYYIYFERDLFSPLDEMSGQIISLENDSHFFQKLYSVFEAFVDINLYATTCMKIRQFRYLFICEPLNPNILLTKKQLEQSVRYFRNRLNTVGLNDTVSFMIYPRPMPLKNHIILYNQTKYQFYQKYWYRRPTTFFIDPDREFVMKEYSVDFNYLNILMLTKNKDIYSYLDQIFGESIRNKDYGGFKVLFCKVQHYLKITYTGKYTDSFKKKELQDASLPELLIWLKMNIANLMEFQEFTTEGADIDTVNKVVDFIKTNYGNPDLTLDKIAASTIYHSNHLNIIFKKGTGITIMDFVNDFRVAVAKHLLLDRELSVQAISKAVGFHSSQYFATVFKKKTGSSPSMYRNGVRHKLE